MLWTCCVLVLQLLVSVVGFRLVVDIRLRPRPGIHVDVIHKTGSTQNFATLPEEDRATATGNMHEDLVK